MDAVISPLAVGTHLGKYLIEEELGQGAFSTVYRVRHQETGKQFVLKQLKIKTTEPPSDKLQLAAFIKEGQLTRGIAESCIVSCLGGFSDISGHFLVFPYVEGETLKQHLETIHFDGQLPFTRFLELATELLKSYRALKKLKLKHGDIKLSNLWLTRGGELRLFDFGAAAFGELDTERWIVLSDAAGITPRALTEPVSDGKAITKLIYYLLTGSDLNQPNLVHRPSETNAHIVSTLLLNAWEQEDTQLDLTELEACLHQMQAESRVYQGIEEMPTRLVPKAQMLTSGKRFLSKIKFAVFAMLAVGIMLWGYYQFESDYGVLPAAIDVDHDKVAELTEVVEADRLEANLEQRAADLNQLNPNGAEAQRPMNMQAVKAAEGLTELPQGQIEEQDNQAQIRELVEPPLSKIIKSLLDNMIEIPAGRFVMGSNYGEPSERPVTTLEVGSFSMLNHEVTFDLLLACIEAKMCPAQLKPGPNSGLQFRTPQQTPMNRVSYHFIHNNFLPWLNGLSEHQFALPTEIQWEYAAKSGSITDYYWGDEVLANKMACKGCEPLSSGRGPSLIKQFPANQFGLFDMLGNVAELVEACWTDDHTLLKDNLHTAAKPNCRRRVIRGGAWSDAPYHSRTSSRKAVSSRSMSSAVGFRLILLAG